MGRVDVDGMLDGMGSATFTEWLAFFQLEPWGCEIEDGRAASSLTMMANAWGKKRRRVEQFMPDRDGRKMLTGAAMVAFLTGLVPQDQRPEGY